MSLLIRTRQAAGFSFPIPFDGTVENLQVSADLFFTGDVNPVNVGHLVYTFTVFRSPSVPNDGTSHVASPYVTTALSESLVFGGPSNPVVTANFYAASKLNIGGSLVVNAGDRIGIRVRPADAASDTSAAFVTQLAFNASLSYTPA